MAVVAVLYGWNVLAPASVSPRRYAGALICLLVVVGSNFILAVFAREAVPEEAD